MSVTDALTHHKGQKAKPERPEDVRLLRPKKKEKKNWGAQLSANRSSEIATATTACSMCLTYQELVMRTDQTAEGMINHEGRRLEVWNFASLVPVRGTFHC